MNDQMLLQCHIGFSSTYLCRHRDVIVPSVRYRMHQDFDGIFVLQINVCVVQASLVEEVISIAALERARELTCVSVLAASIDHITLQLLSSSVKPVCWSLASL